MLIITTVILFLIIISVMVHYEMLLRINILLEKSTIHHRVRVALALLGAMLAHIIEISIFAIAYLLLLRSDQFGELTGEFTNSTADVFYFSLVNYTSLGYGDIIPTGTLRFLAGIESLTGLVLIAWTASFIYIEMQKYWNEKEN